MKKIEKLRQQRDTLRAMYQSWDAQVNGSPEAMPGPDSVVLQAAREALGNACVSLNKILSAVDSAAGYWLIDPDAKAEELSPEDVQRRERRELRTV